MTLASSASRNDYVGTGSLATYSYTFLIFANTDLLVTKRLTTNVEVTLVLTTDYTVTGAGSPSGGTITLVAGNLPLNEVLTIRRVRPFTQTTDIRNQGDFFPEVHEDTFDHLVMLHQQLNNDITGAIRLPETVSPSAVNTRLPVPAANNFFRWNATADAIENATIGSGSIVLPGGNGMAAFTTPNTFTNRTIVAGDGTISVTNGDGQSGNPSLIVPANGIGSSQIAGGAVTTAKIAAAAVTAAELATGSVTNDEVAASVITGQMAETANDNADEILIYDSTASALRRMSRGDFLSETAIEAHVTHSVNQSIANGVWTSLAFDTERADPGTLHSTVTNNSRFTILTTGTYRITGTVQWDLLDAGSQRRIRILKNGTTSIAETDTPRIQPINITNHVAVDRELSATDYVELQVFQDSGSPLNILKTADFTPEYTIGLVDSGSGGGGGGTSEARVEELAAGFKFFEDNSFMPATKLVNAHTTMPAADVETPGTGATITRFQSQYLFTFGGTTDTSIVQWNLPATKSEVLFLVSGCRMSEPGSFMTLKIGDSSDDSYVFASEPVNNRFRLLRADAGVPNEIDTTILLWKPNVAANDGQDVPFGMAIYVDGTNVRCFLRYNGAQWVQILNAADATHTAHTLVELGYQGDNAEHLAIVPILIAHN